MRVKDSGSGVFVAPSRLHPPRLPNTFVSRDRLIEGKLGDHRVTLVCAPAGSGKTMLVADWMNRRTSGGDRVAWLTLQRTDDRPFEFWSAVIQALTAASEGEDESRFRAMSPPRLEFEPRFVVAVARAIAESHLRCLVLDDVHRLQHPAVLEGVDLLVAELPHTITIVLLARSTPELSLYSLVADGSLREVDGPDLAFTPGEAQALFAQVTDRVEPSDVSRLVARTEGWAVGLRLAAVSVSTVPDPDVFIATFEGDQRTVADYLFAEIIRHLPRHRFEFLLATCAPRQLTVELAAHLSGRDDAGDELDLLCRSNALVTQSRDGSGYRLHSLLRSYLMATLNHRDISGSRHQHARAALWYDQHDEPAAALEHASLSRDGDLLNELLSYHGPHMILGGQAARVLNLVGPPLRSGASDLRVALIAGLAALDLAKPDIADEWLRLLPSSDPFPDDPRFSALGAAAIVHRAILGGDVPRALAQSSILEWEPTGDGDVDLIVLNARPPSRMRTGDYTGAILDLERALKLASARHYDQSVLGTLSQLAGMYGAICEWPPARYWAQQAIDFARAKGWGESPRLAYAYLIAAWTEFQTGDSEAQADYAERGTRALGGVHNVEVGIGVRSMQALVSFHHGSGVERAQAAAEFHQVWEGTREADEVSPAMVSQATPQEVRICLLTGNLSWAEEAADRTRRRLPESAEAALAQAQVLAARGNAREALTILGPHNAGAAYSHAPTTSVTADVLAAALEDSLDNHQRSFDALQSALDWGAPHGFRRPFLDAWDDIRPLLTAHRGRFGEAEEFIESLFEIQKSVDDGQSVLGDHALTDRESSLLRDLPAMMTLSEIADARGISENTVKTHVRAIYRKLGTNSRAAAVRAARERGLL